ncbi:hypothetical protein PZA18_22730 [Chitinimonas sp. DQS-5]|uniref:Secreted protein n=2 Tax=Parachitinimonas caeni TaxID=3031301 RepID=A0ABT7E3G0_9NEIS|nr:hypothetical protein [Parachitinimonas caeni]
MFFAMLYPTAAQLAALTAVPSAQRVAGQEWLPIATPDCRMADPPPAWPTAVATARIGLGRQCQRERGTE